MEETEDLDARSTAQTGVTDEELDELLFQIAARHAIVAVRAERH